MSVVWGVDNFGTNWGLIVVTPAIGATLFGIIFAINYDNAAKAQVWLHRTASLIGAYYLSPVDSGFIQSMPKSPTTVCYGLECYSTAFFLMAGSIATACLCWIWAWRGKNGWVDRKTPI